MTSAELVWVARAVLGAMFVLAGATKLRDVPAFVSGALEYRLLPAPLTRRLARVLPVLELALGVVLLLGVAARTAAVASLAVLVTFGLAVGINLWRGRSIPCHCFGASSREVIGAASLVRLAVLALAAVVVAAEPAAEAGLLPSGVPASDVVPLISVVVSATVLMVLLGTLGSLWRELRAARLAVLMRRQAPAALHSGRSRAPRPQPATSRRPEVRLAQPRQG